MKKILSLLVLAGMSGCVSSEQMEKVYGSQTPPMATERAAAVKYIKETFYDPYSIRDASISHAVTLLDTGFRAICVKFNAKNRMGGYVGMTATSLRFRDGTIVSSLQNAPACNDPRMHYAAFPEIQGL